MQSVVLLTVTAFAAAGVSWAARADAPGAPALPTKPSSGSVASFPCPPRPVSTLDMEACAERELLKVDGEFNARAQALWPILDASGKRAFLNAQSAWLTYRKQECTVQCRAFRGGSAAPLAYGQCEIDLTKARVQELTATLRSYCQGAARTGRYARCPGR